MKKLAKALLALTFLLAVPLAATAQTPDDWAIGLNRTLWTSSYHGIGIWIHKLTDDIVEMNLYGGRLNQRLYLLKVGDAYRITAFEWRKSVPPRTRTALTSPDGTAVRAEKWEDVSSGRDLLAEVKPALKQLADTEIQGFLSPLFPAPPKKSRAVGTNIVDTTKGPVEFIGPDNKPLKLGPRPSSKLELYQPEDEIKFIPPQDTPDGLAKYKGPPDKAEGPTECKTVKIDSGGMIFGTDPPTVVFPPRRTVKLCPNGLGARPRHKTQPRRHRARPRRRCR